MLLLLKYIKIVMIVTKIVKTNKKVPSLLAGYPQPHT
jgi:hypothetical protein